VTDAVYYEQPLNERMRIYIRLEHLFKQAAYTLRGYSVWDSRATFATLIDIIDILTRSDFKADLLKELERQQNALAPLTTRHEVDQSHLTQVLRELRAAQESLHGISTQLGQSIRDDDLFSSLRQRHTVAGGDCAMDMPVYHLWLQQAPEQRIEQLESWFKSLELVSSPIALMLSIIRESADMRSQLAAQGFYQQTLETALPVQIIRVALDKDKPYFAEISAGKHRFTIRFLKPTAGRRPVQVEESVAFQLGCCAL
jgi:cell division protein ZapD